MIILSFNLIKNLNDRFVYQLIVLSFGYSSLIINLLYNLEKIEEGYKNVWSYVQRYYWFF